jgi:hypothetical protein
MVVHTCNPSILESKAGKAQVPGQSELHGKTLSQKSKGKSKEGCCSTLFFYMNFQNLQSSKVHDVMPKKTIGVLHFQVLFAHRNKKRNHNMSVLLFLGENIFLDTTIEVIG